MSFFSIENIAFTVLNYPVSYVELVACLSGLVSVYFASKANVFTWPTGIVNEIFLFKLFFQVQLYADMILQVFFFVTTIYGWYFWNRRPDDGSITQLSIQDWIWLVSILTVLVFATGYLVSNLHTFFASLFTSPASYPYIDSLVMVLSMGATILLASKKIENWYLWILTDIICVILYLVKGVIFLSVEYFIFLVLASYGLYNWKQRMNHG